MRATTTIRRLIFFIALIYGELLCYIGLNLVMVVPSTCESQLYTIVYCVYSLDYFFLPIKNAASSHMLLNCYSDTSRSSTFGEKKSVSPCCLTSINVKSLQYRLVSRVIMMRHISD